MSELSSHHEFSELRMLILRSLDGSISRDELEKMEDILKSDSRSRVYYRRCMSLCCELESVLGSQEANPRLENDVNSILDSRFWEIMSLEERTAPSIQIEEPKPKKAPIEMLEVKKLPRVINKSSLYTAIASIAALVFVLIYVQVAPPAASQVATISDSLNAQWARSEYPTEVGSRLWNNEGARWLQKGVIKIEFDYGAEVIIEGPAEFELMDAEKMILRSGRLYAVVPGRATGFTVRTPYSTLIDLGTEFGVKVHYNGDTDVHMFKGEASLIPGQAGRKEERVDIVAGQAKTVNVHGQSQDIEMKENDFIRAVNSKEGFVWRGNPINLVDLVSGGDGFGSDTSEYVIDPKAANESSGTEVNRRSANDYRETPWHSVVDGVFVPNGKTPQIINSRGDIFEECPKTNELYFSEIIFNPLLLSKREITINGVRYGEGYRSGLLMHANLGITFDLDAIRARYSDFEVMQFRSKLGNSDSAPREGDADVWVLVDGQVRYKYFGLAKGQIETIQVELSDADRFLTLITSDGGNGGPERLTDRKPKSTDSDWCLFAEPVIVIE